MRHAKYALAAAFPFLLAFICQAADPVTPKAEPIALPVVVPEIDAPPSLIPGPPPPQVLPKILPDPDHRYLYPTVPYESHKTANGLRIPRGPVGMWWDYARSPQHQGEPDGLWMPIGGASFFTEWKYTWGSTRQFMGSAEAPPVHRQFFNPELPPGYILRAWQPKKYGYVR